MSFDSWLLSAFAKNLKFTPEISSIRRRYRVLCLIVTNFILLLTSLLFEIAVKCFSSNGTNYFIGSLNCAITLCSLMLLKTGDEKAAANTLVLSFHPMFLIMSYSHNISLPCYVALIIFPNFCMLNDFSLKTILCHVILCVLEGAYYLSEASQTFRITLNDQQSFEIILSIIFLLICFVQFNFICLAEKKIEESTWTLATTNFTKSENLTKEIMKVIRAKDSLISFLSHEMKTSLSSIKEDVEYLAMINEKPRRLEELENVNVKIEALQSMIDNMEPHQNEDYNAPLSFPQLLKDSLVVHSNTTREKKISTQAFIDHNLPKELYTNATQLLQIITNLISDVLEKTMSEGRVSIYAIWCREELHHEDIIQPIVNFNEQASSNNDQDYTRVPLNAARLTINTGNAGVIEEILEEFNDVENLNRTQNFQLLEKYPAKGPGSINDKKESQIRPKYWAMHYDSYFDIHHDPVRQIEDVIPLSKGYIKIQIANSASSIGINQINAVNEVFDQNDDNNRLKPTNISQRLWICKQICQKLKGSIRAFKKSNQGVGFVFYIPVDNTPLNNTGLNLANVNLNPREHTKTTALVVDDYDFNRHLHRLLLEKEDVEVTVASDGKEALETYIRRGGDYFDFIMMDVKMPVMDGFQAAKKMREWEREQRKKKIDIYFVSGEYFNEEDVMTQLRVQGDVEDSKGIKCLRKPVDIEMLRQFINKYKLK